MYHEINAKLKYQIILKLYIENCEYKLILVVYFY